MYKITDYKILREKYFINKKRPVLVKQMEFNYWYILSPNND